MANLTARPYTVTYYLRPHLAQFLRSITPTRSVWVSDPRDAVSQFVIACLSRKPGDAARMASFTAGREPFQVTISATIRRNYGRYVDTSGANSFERLVHHLFAHMLITHVHASDGSQMQRISQFMERHGIHDGLIDAMHMQRLMNRLRSRMEQAEVRFLHPNHR